MTQKDERWALFWCKLLHPILFNQIPPKRTNKYLKELSEKEVAFPDGTVKKPAFSTLKRKLKRYRKGGFKGLARKARKDRGRPRAYSQELIDKAVELKKDQASRSAAMINDFLESLYAKTMHRSTMYRYLKEAGATKIKLGVTKKKVRCRWTREHTHELWVGDFEEGPWVRVGQTWVKAHLSGFIDCHSRYVVEARYYLSESFDILIDSLLRAWGVHGAPLQIYLDNAKVYRSARLRCACYQLGVELLHRPEGDPSPGGLIERFFETAQSQFEAEVRADDPLALDQLNRAFSAWLHVHYHRHVHSQTGQPPRERYQTGLILLRPVDLNDIMPFFMKKEQRNVHRDFSDVQLFGQFYLVDQKLRGDKVQVWFDPYSDMTSVLIYSLNGQYLGKGKLHHREKRPQPPPSPQVKPKHSLLDLWVQQHDEILKDQSHGIDYTKLSDPKAPSFPQFCKSLARLLGQEGGLSAFSDPELKLIKKTYDRHGPIDKNLLMQAVENASTPSVLHVLQALQDLLC